MSIWAYLWFEIRDLFRFMKKDSDVVQLTYTQWEHDDIETDEGSPYGIIKAGEELYLIVEDEASN